MTSLSQIVSKLSGYGRFLDFVESGRLALSARQFRKSALFARELLKDNLHHPEVIAICATSPALTEIRDGILMAEALQNGTLAWAFDLKTFSASRP